MIAEFQVQIMEVTTAASDTLRSTLQRIEEAIEEAWAITRRQIEEANFDERISQTAFAQFLVHHVRNEIFKLGTAPGDVETDLIPNRRKSAHHVIVRFGSFWITVSAIKARSDRPRPARFRTDYSHRQMRFVVNEESNTFEAASPPDTNRSIHTYIQLLHGPTPEDRQTHGFTLVAFTNRFGEYEPMPMEISEFLDADKYQNAKATEETVTEAFEIKIK